VVGGGGRGAVGLFISQIGHGHRHISERARGLRSTCVRRERGGRTCHVGAHMARAHTDSGRGRLAPRPS
jgi:hypothetical protein